MAAHRISLARRVFSVGRLSCAQPRPNSANLRGLLVNFLYSGVALSSKPPYASSLRSVPADSVSCTTGCAENTRSAAASEADMPARSFVVSDGVCILGEHAKPTTRARLPKRVRPTSPVLGQKPGGVQGFSPETVARLELVSSIEFG